MGLRNINAGLIDCDAGICGYGNPDRGTSKFYQTIWPTSRTAMRVDVTMGPENSITSYTAYAAPGGFVCHLPKPWSLARLK